MKNKDKGVDRGFYKPKSYRFSKQTTEQLKKLATEHGSQEKALKYLLTVNKNI